MFNFSADNKEVIDESTNSTSGVEAVEIDFNSPAGVQNHNVPSEACGTSMILV